MEDVGLGRVLEAKHDYQYDAENRDGTSRPIEITRGEKYILLRVANEEWWDVIHYDFRTRNEKKFYVPAKYVRPLNLVITESECDHEDFLKRWEKNNRRQRRQNRKSGANQIDQLDRPSRTNQRPLSTFDDGIILSPDARYADTPTQRPTEVYTPSSGISTITRTKLKRESDQSDKASLDSNLHGITVALTASRENLNEAESGNPRLTPVPPPSLDLSRGELLTPEPQYENPPDQIDYAPQEEHVSRTHSPRPIRNRNHHGMSMTVNTANRLNNMPEPVKIKRRSNEDEKSKTLPAKSSTGSSNHERIGSADLTHQLAAHAKTHSRTQSVTDEVFDSEWKFEYDADTGEKLWYSDFYGDDRWQEIYDQQTGRSYYWNTRTNVTEWVLPSSGPNLTTKRGTILYNKIESGKKVTKIINGWGEIHGNYLQIFKTPPKQQGGGTIYDKAPEIKIDLYGSRLKSPSDAVKMKREDPSNYFELFGRNEKFGAVIKDENCWYNEISEKKRNVNGTKRWSGRKSVRNVELKQLEEKLEKGKEKNKALRDANQKLEDTIKKQALPRRLDRSQSKKSSGWSRLLHGRRDRTELISRGIIKSAYFGSSIQEIIKQEKGKVPDFVLWCIEHIEKDLDTDGIYRVAANQATVHSLRLDVDQRVDKSKWKFGNDIHVICGALKLFFRELPDAIIKPKTEMYYQKWGQIPMFTDDQVLFNQLKDLLKHSIDEILKPTLKVLFDHFEKVLSHSTQNRMAAQNIAIVFGPTLIDSPCGTASYETIMTHNNIVQKIIENYPKLKPLFGP